MTMATIKKITDKQGADIYLRTHTKAVVDDNGYTAESRMQAMQDEINQAQLEVGAVPSDLTPTEGSTNWVTSGGLYNQLNVGDANVEIDLTQYTAVRAFPNPSKWIVTNDSYPYYGIFISIEPYIKYRIKANGNELSYYAFLKTNTYSNNDTVDYATGCTRVSVPSNTEIIDTAPNDAHYLWVSTYTTVDRTPQKVEIYNKKPIKEIVEHIDITPVEGSSNLVMSGGVYPATHFAEFLKGTLAENEINFETITQENIYINATNNVWKTGYKSIFIPISTHKIYKITANASVTSRYAFLTTNSYTENTTPSYCEGTHLSYIGAGQTVEVYPPADAKYLNITMRLSSGDVNPQSLVELVSFDYIEEHVKGIDYSKILYDLTIQKIIDARVSSATFGEPIAATNNEWGCSQFIDLLGAKYVKYYANIKSTSNNYANVTGTVFYNEHKEALADGVRLIENGSAINGWITQEIPSGARYMRIGLGYSHNKSTQHYVLPIKITTENVYGLQEKIDEIDEKANKEEYNVLRNSRYSADGATSGTVGFLHFSDIHGDEGAAKAIKAYYDKYSSYINNMLSTGDVVYYYAADGIDFYTQNGLTDALMALGNHDGASQTGSNVQGSADWDAMGAQWDYETYYAPYISGWGVTQPTDAATNYLMYYYKDYTTPKVRLIVLDVMHQTAEQLQWFTDTLADAVTNDYTVVVASHYIPNTYIETNIVKQSNGDKTTFHWQGSNELTSIDSRFKLATTYADAVETFIANGGKFAVWLCGHYHTDYLTYCNTHPNILFCAINQAGYRRGGAQGYRVVGDHCANMVTIHPALGVIKIHRIGLTTDKYLRPINVLVYDYVNKKVISNY